MNLDKESVYNCVWSYKNAKRFNDDQMAELLGMKSRQGFKSMMDGKTMTLDQLVSFMTKTGKSLEDVFMLGKNVNEVNDEKSPAYGKKSLESRVNQLEDGLNEIFLYFKLMKKAEDLKKSIDSKANARG